MQQLVIEITANCNEQSVVCNNWLFKLQPTVLLQFCNITAGYDFNYQLLHKRFCLLSESWIKANDMI